MFEDVGMDVISRESIRSVRVESFKKNCVRDWQLREEAQN